ncbi:MAG TPA: ABC transporter ATP-binding protein [Alphaproteobacteria bacterium]|nr:ABC transporter ATP-binding protein [Alphaproteobacteria bacterium]
MIRFENVGLAFDGRPVLQGIDLALTERRIAVIGANGSGKSTLARLINGLVLPTTGRVAVDGLDTRREGKAVRRRVGFVFQNPDHQIVMPLVEEDLAFGLKGSGLPAAERERRIAAVLARYGLEGYRQHPAHALSGGEKQMLAIAGVLVAEPEIVVMDEPTTLLDLRNKRRIAAIVAGLAQRVVMVTHDLDLIAGFDRVLVVEGGRIAADGPPDRAVPAYLDLVA